MIYLVYALLFAPAYLIAFSVLSGADPFKVVTSQGGIRLWIAYVATFVPAFFTAFFQNGFSARYWSFFVCVTLAGVSCLAIVAAIVTPSDWKSFVALLPYGAAAVFAATVCWLVSRYVAKSLKPKINPEK